MELISKNLQNKLNAAAKKLAEQQNFQPKNQEEWELWLSKNLKTIIKNLKF